MKSGEIVLVKFPFTALETTKKRPALVLNKVSISPKLALITIAMITSKVDGLKINGDVHIKQWKEADLLHPSLVRLSKIATIELENIDKSIGQIEKSDHGIIKKEFQKLFKLWLD